MQGPRKEVKTRSVAFTMMLVHTWSFVVVGFMRAGASLLSFDRMRVRNCRFLFRKVLLSRDLRSLAVAAEKHEIKGSFFFLISLSYEKSSFSFSTKVSHNVYLINFCSLLF